MTLRIKNLSRQIISVHAADGVRARSALELAMREEDGAELMDVAIAMMIRLNLRLRSMSEKLIPHGSNVVPCPDCKAHGVVIVTSDERFMFLHACPKCASVGWIAAEDTPVSQDETDDTDDEEMLQ